MSNGLKNTVIIGIFLLIVGPVVGGGIIANRALQDRAVMEVRERLFVTSCGTYKSMTKWERWSTPHGWTFGWCDDYLQRMEG